MMSLGCSALRYTGTMLIESQKLKGLRRAVADHPEDVDLRLELIAELLAVDHPQSAWHHCLRILNGDPEHLEALRRAREAAAAAGWPNRADEYGELLDVLNPAENGTPPKPDERQVRVKGRILRVIEGGREDSGVHTTPRS